MNPISLSYSQFISLVVARELLLQYKERTDRYHLFVIEDGLTWETFVLKNGGANVVDFETHYKATANMPLKGQKDKNKSLPVVLPSDQIVLSTITDASGTVKAGITPTGRLLVSQEPPPPPAGTTLVLRTQYTSMAGTQDNFYIITNGKTLNIQKFSAGGEIESNSGSVVELWSDPNGTGVGMQIIDSIFTSGNSDQHDLNQSFSGNGTVRILLRRKRLSGGTRWIFGRWEGYES